MAGARRARGLELGEVDGPLETVEIGPGDAFHYAPEPSTA